MNRAAKPSEPAWVDIVSIAVALGCKVEFDRDCKCWRAWDEHGNEAFAEWKPLAAARLLGFHMECVNERIVALRPDFDNDQPNEGAKVMKNEKNQLIRDLREIVSNYVALRGTGCIPEHLRPLADACARRSPDHGHPEFLLGYLRGRHEAEEMVA